MPPATPEWGWYVFEAGILIMVFVDMEGPILSPMSGHAPVRMGTPFYGKIIIVDELDRLLSVIDDAPDPFSLIDGLEDEGFQVIRTPADSLRSFLDV